MELDLDESQESFKSSQNSLSSSISGQQTIKNSTKIRKGEKKSTHVSKKDKNNLPKPIQQKNKLPQVNLENILYNQRSITKLIKNIFRRILDVNCTNQSYNLFLEKLSTTDFKFYDNQFPPNLNSLIKGCQQYQNLNININSNGVKKPSIIIDNNPLKKYKNVVWKRESEISDFPDIFPKMVF